MKKILSGILGAISLLCMSPTFASNLLDVYKDAVQNDPQFQEALANRDIIAQQVPLNFATLLPQLAATETAQYQKTHLHGHNSSIYIPGNIDTTLKQEGLAFELTVSQTIFNFTNWMTLASARNNVKAAYATYSSEVQSLIQRVSQAYFNVLEAEDNLRYAKAAKEAYYKQYIQAKEGYEVGLKTITDMYNAKASYDSGIATVVAAINGVHNAREDLLAITGKNYGRLAPLTKLPLVKPVPANINSWTHITITHNWELTAAHYTMIAQRDLIKSARGGHMPTVNFNGSYENAYAKDVGGDSGSNRAQNSIASVVFDMPIYSGGAVTAQVKQAIASYNLASGQFQQTYRTAVKNARQSYLGALSGISKVHADEQAVVSQKSSLEGMEEGYRVGTRTIVDVLNAESSLYNAEQENATDRYGYVISLINLKQAAGTLDVNDIARINGWLGPIPIKPPPKKP